MILSEILQYHRGKEKGKMKERLVPYIGKNHNETDTLYVDGKPYLILGGEIHNSSFSSLEYMEKRVWPYIRSLHLNTLLVPIAWECIEPQEGIYDFSLLQGILEQARREHMRLVLLWFGVWKNGESFYVPEWVKEDTERFFRAVYRQGNTSDTISPLCEEAVEKDKQAFSKLMEYLKEYDAQHTVIMVQVENEIGFLKSDRDYSEIAEKKFQEEIPQALKELCGTEGTWEEAFGADAAEYFMAFHYAQAVEKIASAGKEILPLPMYVNAWLEQHPDRAGEYPSGGPVAKLIPLWRKVAVSIDMACPDIYVLDFKAECENYHVKGNPLFIPEASKNAVTVSNMFYALGEHNGLGYSPFGIEDILYERAEEVNITQLQELNIAVDAAYDRNTAPYLIQGYKLIQGAWERILDCRGSDRMMGYIQANPYERGCVLPMGEFDIQLDYTAANSNQTGSAGIIFPEKNGFYIIGCNTRFKVLPPKGKNIYIGIPRYEEGIFENGEWKRGRILNGDEVYAMSLKEMPEARYVRVFTRK